MAEGPGPTVIGRLAFLVAVLMPEKALLRW
jgi:hypothetical protein